MARATCRRPITLHSELDMTTRRPRRPTVAPTPVNPIQEEAPSVEINTEEKEIAEFLDSAAEELFEFINDMETIQEFVVTPPEPSVSFVQEAIKLIPPAPSVGFAQEIPKPLPRYIERKNSHSQYRRG